MTYLLVVDILESALRPLRLEIGKTGQGSSFCVYILHWEGILEFFIAQPAYPDMASLVLGKSLFGVEI